MRDLKSNVDDNLANVVLKNAGLTIATIADPMSKSLTFKLATPVVIRKGQTQIFDVYADIVDGAGEQIDLVINNEVYVLGSDSRYGYGIAVAGTSTYSSQVFTITAGKVTLTKLSNPSRLAREDKDDLVLANFQLTSNDSSNLTLEDIKFISNNAVSLASNVSGSYFENVEVKVMNGTSLVGTYSLESMSSTSYGDTDLSITIPGNGALTIQLIADVKKPLPAGYTGVTFNYTLSASGLRIIENADDNIVTDIVPSSITFDTMRFVAASAAISSVNLSNISVVKGSSNVQAIAFNLLTDEVSPVRFETLVLQGNTEFNSNRVAAVRLYRGTYPNGTLVKEESQFAGNTVTVDDVNIEVPAKSTQPMYVTIDTVSIASSNVISVEVASVVAKDAENNDSLTVAGLPTISTRDIMTTSAGTLTTALVTSSDSKVNKAKLVVGGTESSEVAAFELTLSNDTATMKNVNLGVSGVNFGSTVVNAMLLSSTGLVIDPTAEVLDNGQIQFNNVDKMLAVGTTKFYVKVLANQIGNNGATEISTPYSIKLNSVDVEWNSDGGTQTYAGPATYSNLFYVRAVRISNVSLAAGSNAGPLSTDRRVASVTFTADTSSNTTAAGATLKAKIEMLKITF